MPVKGPKPDATGELFCVRVTLFPELSTKGVDPCSVNKLVPDTAVRAAVGAVKLEVYRAVPFTTLRFDIKPEKLYWFCSSEPPKKNHWRVEHR